MLNVTAPQPEQGFRVYHNGNLAANVTRILRSRATAQDGKIVIGRSFSDTNSLYTSLEIDELIFINRAVNDDEIRMMSN